VDTERNINEQILSRFLDAPFRGRDVNTHSYSHRQLTLGDLHQTRHYLGLMDIPNIPIILPYNPTGDLPARHDGYPAVVIGVSCPIAMFEFLPPQIQDILIQNNVKKEQLYISFACQNFPWDEKEQLEFKAHHWIHGFPEHHQATADATLSINNPCRIGIFDPTDPNIRCDGAVNALSASPISVNSHPTQKEIKTPMIICSPKNVGVITGLSTNQSSSVYSIAMAPNGKTVVTLHWLLCEADQVQLSILTKRVLTLREFVQAVSALPQSRLAVPDGPLDRLQLLLNYKGLTVFRNLVDKLQAYNTISISQLFAQHPRNFIHTIETLPGQYQLLILTRSKEKVLLYAYDTQKNYCIELAPGPSWSDANGWTQPQYDATLRTAVIRMPNGEERLLLLARTATGIQLYSYSPSRNNWAQLALNPNFNDKSGFDLTDKNGCNKPEYYSTLRMEVIRDQTGKDQLWVMVRFPSGMGLSCYDPISNTWQQHPLSPSWSDQNGWDKPPHYSTIQTEVMRNAQGKEQLWVLGRSEQGIQLSSFDPNQGWMELPTGPSWKDALGWTNPQHNSTIQTQVIRLKDGAERLLLTARASTGILLCCFDPTAKTWRSLAAGPSWNDSVWGGRPGNYATIHTAIVTDINGDEQLLISGAADGKTETFCYDPLTNAWTPSRPANHLCQNGSLHAVILQKVAIQQTNRATDLNKSLLYQSSYYGRLRTGNELLPDRKLRHHSLQN